MQVLTDSVKSRAEPKIDSVKQNINAVISQAQENPTVKKGVESVKSAANKVHIIYSVLIFVGDPNFG